MTKVELLYFGGCPGYRKAERESRSALVAEGAGCEVEMVAVETDEEAERPRFPGSPTIRVDGEDLFPEGLGPRASWRLGCRLYGTPEGPKDQPTAETIRARLPRGSGEEW